MPFPILIFIAFGVLIAVGAYFSHLQAKKRRAELEALAAQLGWRFDPSSVYDHDSRFRQFAIFCNGHSQRAYNTLHGTLTLAGQSVSAQMGDFLYKQTSGSGKNRRTTTHALSYLIVGSPIPTTPDLLIRPEGAFDKVSAFFGFDDIDFESAEFSRAFHVSSSDKRFAYAVVHPRMMEFLLETRGPSVAVAQGYGCVYEGTRVWTPDEFRVRLGWVERFFEQWPGHVTDQYAQAPV